VTKKNNTLWFRGEPQLEENMALLGFILLVVSAISVVYPLRFLMIPNRLVAICGVVMSFAIIGSTTPTAQTTKTASAERKLHTPALADARPTLMVI
jgi:hypothetical protein